jgi:hypothetical protein
VGVPVMIVDFRSPFDREESRIDEQRDDDRQ